MKFCIREEIFMAKYAKACSWEISIDDEFGESGINILHKKSWRRHDGILE
jgi:hypothetical protein